MSSTTTRRLANRMRMSRPRVFPDGVLVIDVAEYGHVSAGLQGARKQPAFCERAFISPDNGSPRGGRRARRFAPAGRLERLHLRGGAFARGAVAATGHLHAFA